MSQLVTAFLKCGPPCFRGTTAPHPLPPLSHCCLVFLYLTQIITFYSRVLTQMIWFLWYHPTVAVFWTCLLLFAGIVASFQVLSESRSAMNVCFHPDLSIIPPQYHNSLEISVKIMCAALSILRVNIWSHNVVRVEFWLRINSDESCELTSVFVQVGTAPWPQDHSWSSTTIIWMYENNTLRLFTIMPVLYHVIIFSLVVTFRFCFSLESGLELGLD